jgi:hypothetical protein
MNPSWSSTGATSDIGHNVVEKIVFGNVGPEFDEFTLTEVFTSSGDRRLFYLSNKNIQKINSVKVDGASLDYSEYTYSREQGFVTINTIASSTVEINYNFSKSLDMLVTNWDPSVGNYMYYNKLNIVLIPNLDCDGELSWSDVEPGGVAEGSFGVFNMGDDFSSLNWEIESYPDWGTWTFTPESGFGLIPGEGGITVNINVIAPDQKNSEFIGDLKVVNIDDTSDYEVIPVTLKTPKIYNKVINTPFLNFLEEHQNLFQILQKIIQRLEH